PVKVLTVVLRKTALVPAMLRLPVPVIGPLTLVFPEPELFWKRKPSVLRTNALVAPVPRVTVAVPLPRVISAPVVRVRVPVGLTWTTALPEVLTISRAPIDWLALAVNVVAAAAVSLTMSPATAVARLVT